VLGTWKMHTGSAATRMVPPQSQDLAALTPISAA
jgi:hypothetical protein